VAARSRKSGIDSNRFITKHAAMRVNQPVTQREFEFPADATLVSRTDTKSHITYANAAFVTTSGFEVGELMGQPHNLVRHPDMPAQAFEDMWRTLQQGQSWSALVKNRRKDGDHYWVRANATPIEQGGQTVGYLSVRTKPKPGEVAQADRLLASMQEGKSPSVSLHKGLLIRPGLGGWRSWRQTMPTHWRVLGPLAALGLSIVVLAASLGLPLGALAALILGTLVATSAAMAWLYLQIVQPLEALSRHTQRVANGDSTNLHELDRVDALGMTFRCVNQLGLMFRWIISDVAQQAGSVHTASVEIAQGNNDLSTRTEHAAADLQRSAASMEQMSAAVHSNAETATQATALATATSAVAQLGEASVNQMHQTMQDITTASRRINDIIGVIDGIAFQTNILALNAAVEAARAGEQGRGFAVVAGEVRSLAQRSASAAKEIKKLIGDSVMQVDLGAQQVVEAANTMHEVLANVNAVQVLISEISLANHEQSLGIAQVTDSVSHLEKSTQQNAALVEQSAAAAESLQSQASHLASAVAVFKH
jgi:aerotaxis receptor